MELESLKYIWRSQETPPAPEPDRSAMLALLEQRSRGPVARMRRNLVGEGILLLITYIPGILCYILEFEGRLSAMSWLLGLLAVAFGAYYYRKYRLLSEMQCVTCQVRSNLSRQVKTLRKYTRCLLPRLCHYRLETTIGRQRPLLPPSSHALVGKPHILVDPAGARYHRQLFCECLVCQ
jgi:hypothetical protein